MNIFLKDHPKALLVLGKAGAGKSTLLLDFALECINLALSDTRVPIPLILSLAFWSRTQLSLEEWICVECEASYGNKFSIEKCRQFLQNKQILPLFDGLDEVHEKERTACIQAINTYRQNKEVLMIVTSRTEEYKSASEKLDLLQAIELCPLEKEQVEASFDKDGPPLKALLDVYQNDIHLKELATTPLIVNILRATYWDRPVDADEFSGFEKTTLLRHVLDEYVNRMLKPHHGRSLPYPSEQAKKWLSWIACQIQVRWPPIFSLELLEPDWLSPSYRNSYARSRTWLGKRLGMLIWGLLATLLWVFAPLRSLSPLLAVGAVLGYFPYLRLFSRWTEERSRAEQQPLVEILVEMDTRAQRGQPDTPLQNAAEDRHRARAERLALASQSARGWMICEVASGPLFGLVSGLIFGRIGGPILGINVAVAIWLAAWLVYLPFLLKNMVVKKYMVRYWLYRSGVFPWHAVSFLEEARVRGLLQRDGKNYRFMHSLFLEYFVDVAHREHVEATEPKYVASF